jgi:DNA-binding beta-propeller fold protein YncE
MKKILSILFLVILCSGCATTPERPAAPMRPLFYPPLPQQPRLEFLHSISGEDGLGRKQGAFKKFVVGPIPYRQLGRPYDICAAKGKLYVMDRMYKRVVVLDLAKERMSFLNDHGAGSLGDPSGIWVSDDGRVYVADMQRKQVVAFDGNGGFLKAYGGKGVFEKPVAVAVYGNRVYVVDMVKQQLFILDRETGKLLKAVGEKGDFFRPSHVTVGPKGNVFVNDAFHFVVKKFSPDGVLLATIGFHGDQIGGFARPKGLAVDRKGLLYVVDAAFENVQIFDGKGQLLLFFGGPGNGPGNLYLPAGIAIDYDNVAYFQKFADPDFKLEYLVYVTSMFGGNKVSVYGFGHWIGQSLPGQ